MKVRELMTKNPATCTPETNIQNVAQLMEKHDCGAIPIADSSDDRKVVGIVTDRDIVTRLVAKGTNPLESQASDAMTASIVSVNADDTVEDCAELMEEKQVRRLIVTDDGGSYAGIVAQADVALRTSDEMTGEVVEEVSERSQKAAEPVS